MKSIIDKLGISFIIKDSIIPFNCPECGYEMEATVYSHIKIKELEQQRNELLEALIEWALQWEKQFEPSRLFEETVSVIEKATGLEWEKIKELYELHD